MSNEIITPKKVFDSFFESVDASDKSPEEKKKLKEGIIKNGVGVGSMDGALRFLPFSSYHTPEIEL